jgi:hypothetical protein
MLWQERLLLVNSILSDDVTDMARAWPMQLSNKDSRVSTKLKAYKICTKKR